MIQALLASPYIDFNFAIPELEGDTVLHLVLRTSPDRFRDSKGDIFKILIQNGVNPLQCDRLGDTALHILAGCAGSIELLKYLLGEPSTTSTNPILENLQSNCRRHINLQNSYKNTPLGVAVLYNCMDSIELLLSHGADPNIDGDGGHSALDFATKRQYIEASTLLKSCIQMLGE
jgi:ankyrin repeat protein